MFDFTFAYMAITVDVVDLAGMVFNMPTNINTQEHVIIAVYPSVQISEPHEIVRASFAYLGSAYFQGVL